MVNFGVVIDDDDVAAEDIVVNFDVIVFPHLLLSQSSLGGCGDVTKMIPIGVYPRFNSFDRTNNDIYSPITLPVVETITKKVTNSFQISAFLDVEEEQIHMELEKIPNRKLMILPVRNPA